MLQALDYEIRGITPEPLMEEIWYSLPSLRKVLEFEDGWDSAKTFAWQRLNTAASSMCLFLLLELKGVNKVTQ